MPAIQLARLRRQADELAQHFENPEVFVRQFTDLLEFYADRTHRPSQSGSNPLLKAYRIPDPVLRRILIELTPFCQHDPEGTLALADTCWAQEIFEFRLLALNLLGKVPPEMAEEITSRAQAWNQENLEENLLQALTTTALAPLRENQLEAYIQLVEASLDKNSFIANRLGLQAMLVLLQDSKFENLPLVYRLLTPVLERAGKPLHPDLLAVLRRLAERSPQETAYYLRQRLAGIDSKLMHWLARKSLSAFPPEMEKDLRELLREKS
jgi:hypothetical protein